MKIKHAPFAPIAVPNNPAPVAASYWTTDLAVEEIAARFGYASVKAVKKAAGEARLSGITCLDCKTELVVSSREKANQAIKEFDCRSRFRSGVRCPDCDHAERERRQKEQLAKWRAERIELSPPRKREAKQSRHNATTAAKKEFYESWEWRELRLKTLQKHGRVCLCCGNRPGMFYASGEPVRIVVDHIKPISKYWHLRLDPSNLQPLCDECNQGKGNWDETDFRSPEAPDEWVETPQEDIVLSVLNELNEGSTVQ